MNMSVGNLQISNPINDIENLRSKAVNSTKNLLDIENIVHIVYVDDKFDISGQKEEYIARLKMLKQDGNYINTDTFKDIDWEGPSMRFESLIDKLWEKTDNKSDLLHEVCSHKKDQDSANVIPALEISECYGDRIKLMTPDQWIADSFQSLKGLKEGERVLCLFDFEFQNGNKLLEGRTGADLAKSLIEQEELTDRVVCGIFSHKFTEEQEDEFRIKYSTDFGIDVTKFYTISKYRFAFDPQITGFAEGIKNLLLQPYIEQLKLESLDVLNNSNNRAGQRIKEITPKTFNQIVQKSSLKEGVWEVSTLFRLYGILSKEENLNMISDPAIRQRFNDSIKKIREIDLTETGYKSDISNQQLINLRNSELYLNGDIVNKLHLPISNGDIFKIKGKEYILLVQPCNLAIRANGKECGVRSKNYNNAFLIPIKSFPIEKSNHTKQEILSPTNTPENTHYAYFPEFKVMSLDFIDLTAFNEDGTSFINMNNLILNNDVIHFPLKKRYEYIYARLKEIETRINSFLQIKKSISCRVEELKSSIREYTKDMKKMKPEEREIILDIISPLKIEKKNLEYHVKTVETNIYSIDNFELFKLNSLENYNNTTRIFQFDINRIKHYKSPFSDDLLQKFMLYLSRNAFDHDFTNE